MKLRRVFLALTADLSLLYRRRMFGSVAGNQTRCNFLFCCLLENSTDRPLCSTSHTPRHIDIKLTSTVLNVGFLVKYDVALVVKVLKELLSRSFGRPVCLDKNLPHT